MNLYTCSHCGNIAVKLTDSGVPMVCCGAPMSLMEAGTSDGAVEKHLPVVERQGDSVTVTVGSQTHPMLDAHYIAWILLESSRGFQVCNLAPGQEPKAVFALAQGETPVAAYAFCNLHGLWKTDIA